MNAFNNTNQIIGEYIVDDLTVDRATLSTNVPVSRLQRQMVFKYIYQEDITRTQPDYSGFINFYAIYKDALTEENFNIFLQHNQQHEQSRYQREERLLQEHERTNQENIETQDRINKINDKILSYESLKEECIKTENEHLAEVYTFAITALKDEIHSLKEAAEY